MRALFLIQGFEVPASRYRVLQYLSALQAAGIEPEIRPFPKNRRERGETYGGSGRFDLAFIQRKRLNPWEILRLRRKARNLVYDIDDAVMFKDTRSLGKQRSRTRERRFARMVVAADRTIAGNNFLARLAAAALEGARRTGRIKGNPRDLVSVLPTSLDMARYAPRTWNGTPERITLGWIGDTGSIGYLERWRPVLEKIGREVPGLQFKIVSSRSIGLDAMPVISKSWSAEDELVDLQSFDIGIMPVDDDPWSQGKCGLKLLQYMGAGVPVVCSPVGVNADIVRDGTEGCFATTPEAWVDRIRRLAADPGLRARMGAAAFERVRSGYALDRGAERLIDILHEVAGDRTDG